MVMQVRVNGKCFCSRTGLLEIKRRYGSGAVLVSIEEGRPCIAAVDPFGRFMVSDGCSYDVYSLQTGDAQLMSSLASQCEAKLSQRTTKLFLEASQQQEQVRKRSRNCHEKRSRRKGNYVCFVQSFMKGFMNVSFADAAKEWRQFSEELKQTASVECLMERVRAKGLYEAIAM